MSTTKQLSIYKNYNNKIKLRANGYWDKIVRYIGIESDNNDCKQDMVKYDGLKSYINTLLPVWIADFRKTILPWKWGYGKRLENGVACLKPLGERAVVELPQYAYNGSFNGKLTFDSDTSVMRGFNTDNYFITNTSFAQNAHAGAWEVRSKFKLYTNNVWNALFGGESGTYLPDLFVDSRNVLEMNLASTGYAYDIASSIMGTTKLETDKDYWVKFGWTGSEYYAELSDDGVHYKREITFASSTAIRGIYNKLMIGYRVGSYFHGEVYLNETCFIYANGTTYQACSVSTTTTKELEGCLYNCSIGNELQELNAFVVNGDERVVLTTDEQYGDSRYLGKVTIPATGGEND